jgi:hypothetical protein
MFGTAMLREPLEATRGRKTPRMKYLQFMAKEN